jgi:hypothetical protein
VNLAVEGERTAAGLNLPHGLGFQRARRLIREALVELGTAEAIDAEVREILAAT